jgi:hypothetical protein
MERHLVVATGVGMYVSVGSAVNLGVCLAGCWAVELVGEPGAVLATWQYAMWGVAGGFVVEGLEFRVAIRRVGG